MRVVIYLRCYAADAGTDMWIPFAPMNYRPTMRPNMHLLNPWDRSFRCSPTKPISFDSSKHKQDINFLLVAPSSSPKQNTHGDGRTKSQRPLRILIATQTGIHFRIHHLDGRHCFKQSKQRLMVHQFTQLQLCEWHQIIICQFADAKIWGKFNLWQHPKIRQWFLSNRRSLVQTVPGIQQAAEYLLAFRLMAISRSFQLVRPN